MDEFTCKKVELVKQMNSSEEKKHEFVGWCNKNAQGAAQELW